MLPELFMAAAMHTLIVSQPDGSPVSGALIVTVGDPRTTTMTDDEGRAHIGAPSRTVRITAQGCQSRTIALRAPIARVLLMCARDTIASVTVATGSIDSLHRLPVAASILTRSQIARSSALSGDEVLRGLPGVDRDRSNSMFTNYGQLRVSFAGAGTDRGAVFVDGVPAQDGFGGQIDWALYPSAEIERAELLRGAGSALYGSGAIGGVLAISTFTPSIQSPSRASLDFDGGTHQQSNLHLRLFNAIAPRVAASFAVGRQTFSYRDLPPGYATALDEPAFARAMMTSLRVRYDASATTTLAFGYRSAWDDQQQGRPNYDFHRRLAQADVRAEHVSALATASVQYFIRNGLVTNRADQFPVRPGILRYTQSVPTNESGAIGTWVIAQPNATFSLRVDDRVVHGESDQFGPSGAPQTLTGGSQSLGGLALQEALRGPHAQLIVGLRGDGVAVNAANLSRTQAALSPRLALRVDLSPRIAIRVSDGAGFRPPYLNELLRGYQVGSIAYLPNAALVPERSSTLSTGIDWSHGNERLSFDVVRTFVNDAIAFRTIDATHQIRSNGTSTRTDGQTLTFTRMVGPCARVSLSTTAQFARNVGGSSSVIGKRLQYVPKATGTLAFDGALGSVETGLSLSYLGPTYADDLNTQALGTALISGVYVGLPTGGASRIVIRADNLTNARYLSSIDRYGPPRALSIGLALPLQRHEDSPRAVCPVD